MGKHRNGSLHRTYFQEMYIKARDDIKEINTKYNILQKKHNELKAMYAVAEKTIKTQRKIIEELEERLAQEGDIICKN